MGTPDETMTSAIAGHQANIFVIHNNGESMADEDLKYMKEVLGADLVLRDGEKGLTFPTYGKDKEIASSVTIMAAQDIPVRDPNPVAMLEDEAEVFRRVGAINTRAKVGEIPIPLKQRRFEATQIFAAPNWQISSTMFIPPGGGGGPGKPRYVAEEKDDSPKFDWNTPQAVINAEKTGGTRGQGKKPKSRDVNVFILDALPPKKVVDDWRGYPGKHRLKKVLNVANLYWAEDNNIELLPAVQRPGHPEDLFCRTRSENIQAPGSDWALNLPDDENISDHGVFIAGIIHSIAPNAKLHLIQVLNDGGAGTMRSLAQGLQFMGQIMRRPENQGKPAVVNLSLAFCNPEQIIRDAIDHHYSGQIHIWAKLLGIELSDQEADWEDEPAKKKLVDKLAVFGGRFFDQTVQPMELIYELAKAVATPNTVFVAAAGNDGGKLPRYPATSPIVYGVGAVGEAAFTAVSPERTQYSNNPPDTQPLEGSWVFGGDYVDETEKEKGILGISTMTSTGYAWWAGTSFATAAMSGMLARYIRSGRSADAHESVKFFHDNCKRGKVKDHGTLNDRGPLVDIKQH